MWQLRLSHEVLIAPISVLASDGMNGLLTVFTWASADFFPGEGKIFHWPKKHLKKILFSSKKVKKTYYFDRPGGHGPPLALHCGCPCVFSL